MGDQVWLTEERVERLRPHVPAARPRRTSPPHVPKVRGKPGSDDRTGLGGIIHVKRNGLRWRDVPAICGPHETLPDRVVRWSRPGVFAGMFGDLARPGAEGDTLMIDSTHLKAHRTAASLKQGARPRAIGRDLRAG